MYFTDHLKEDDKYPVFIDGNHALTEITNTNAKNGTILLIKDSFSHSLAPFLAENYSKVVLVDLRYYKENVPGLLEVSIGHALISDSLYFGLANTIQMYLRQLR